MLLQEMQNTGVFSVWVCCPAAKNTLFAASGALFGVTFFEVRGAKCELIFDTGQNKSQFLRHRMMDMNMKSVLGNEKITASTPA